MHAVTLTFEKIKHLSMSIPTPLFETAEELFTSIANIDEQWPIRTRYNVLREVLNVAVNQRLSEVTIKLSGLYAKIDYLIKTNRLREKDKELSFALNQLRHRLMSLTVTNDEVLSNSYEADKGTLVLFIGYIYEATIPAELSECVTKGKSSTPPSSHENKQLQTDCLRCRIDHWDDTYIYGVRDDTDEAVRIDYTQTDGYVPGDWTYLRRCMVQGEVMNVIRPRTSGDVLVPELLIYAPDYLVNVTSVAACFHATGVSPYWDLLNRIKPSANTEAILLGNFAGQLLDEVVHNQRCTYNESIQAFFKQNALAFLACHNIDENFHTKARAQRENIENLLHRTLKEQAHTTFSADQLILEPTFFSSTLGLQGRMDFLTLNHRLVIEQKSGKGQYRPGADNNAFGGMVEAHYVQALLYRALLHYDYDKLPYEQMQAFLLYSRYADGLQETPSAPKLLFEALKIRNQLAWLEAYYAQGGMQLLDALTPERINPDGSGVLWQRYTRPNIERLLSPIHQATPLERAYYFRFLQFVANEQALSKIGNRTKEHAGFAALWNASLEDKRSAGNIYEQMTIVPQEEEGKVTDVLLCFDHVTTQSADSSNFRIGDIVLFYPYEPHTIPCATHTMVFRGSITDISLEHVAVRLRNAQTRVAVFNYFKDKVWALEHDYLDSSSNALYRGLHAFLSATKERRDLVLGQMQPRTEAVLGASTEEHEDEFKNLALRVQRAKDLFLVIGPPGTGKTSFGMTSILNEELLVPGASVLLLSYTNRAVDEMCSKLIELGIDFIRLGSDFNCAPTYKAHLLSERLAETSNLMQVRSLLTATRVVCATVASINGSGMPLLQLKRFSLAIVDEASQILEPHLIGLLSARCGEGNAIERFVLIGDEKQLPAVVQQGHDEAAVHDEQLQSIGLHHCDASFFERMLRLYAYLPDGSLHPEVAHMLTHQGRMHPDVAEFANTAFYGGQLQCVPVPHQTEELPTCSPSDNLFEHILQTQRLAFISCVPNLHPDEPDKVNTVEAECIAQLIVTYYMQHTAFDTATSVGVIVPYRNQIATVRSAIDRFGIEALHHISIDTVERYQGSQRDLIIYSFTAKRKYQLQFLTSNAYYDEVGKAIIDRKLNVALTRARKQMVLIGYAPLLHVDATFGRLINYCKHEHAFYQVDDGPHRSS